MNKHSNFFKIAYIIIFIIFVITIFISSQYSFYDIERKKYITIAYSLLGIVGIFTSIFPEFSFKAFNRNKKHKKETIILIRILGLFWIYYGFSKVIQI